jgi:hypothetical protein
MHPKGMTTRHQMPDRERANYLELTNDMRGMFMKEKMQEEPKRHNPNHICTNCGYESKTKVENSQCVEKCKRW